MQTFREICGYVPFFLESLKRGGFFAWNKPSLYKEGWSVIKIKDKYYYVQFETVENKNNWTPGKVFTGRGAKWAHVQTEDSLIAMEHSIWAV